MPRAWNSCTTSSRPWARKPALPCGGMSTAAGPASSNGTRNSPKPTSSNLCRHGEQSDDGERKEKPMTEFIVHSIPGSPFGRAVLATLEEKSASYRLAPLAPGAHRSAEHLARHPFGRVPVLEHGAFSLYETQAILRYLDRTLPSPALTPDDPRPRRGWTS